MSTTMGFLLAACAVAVATDVTRRRIPNWLTLGLALASLGVHAAHGLGELGSALAAMIAVFTIGFIAFTARVLGGGDVKLFAAGAAAVGYPDALSFVLYSLVAGGVLALAFAATQGRLAATLRGTGAVIAISSYRASAVAVPARGTTLPYAIAIAAGAVILVLAKTIAPALRLSL